MRLFGQLTKIEDQPDGTLKVYGVASTGSRDDAGEIVTPAAMRAALPDYARYPALREMHQPNAAGRTLEATVGDDGVTRIVAQVVDPVAIAKVKSRTYAGFSIGGKVLARDPADPTTITKIKLAEISLVDRPANPEAVIDLKIEAQELRVVITEMKAELVAEVRELRDDLLGRIEAVKNLHEGRIVGLEAVTGKHATDLARLRGMIIPLASLGSALVAGALSLVAQLAAAALTGAHHP